MSNLDWRVHETAHFVFHFAPNSDAAHRLAWLEGRAETAWRLARGFTGEAVPPAAKIRIHCDVVVPHPEPGGAPPSLLTAQRG